MNLHRVKALIGAAVLISIAAPAAYAEDQGPGRVAYDRNGDIYTANANGTDELALTHDDGDSHTPKWSPDGQQILFIRNTSLQSVLDADGIMREIGQPTDFYLVNRNGSNAHRLKHLDGVVSDPSWSPDGKQIGFYYQSKEEWLHQGQPPFTGGFFVLPIEKADEERPRLISTEARHIDWSPDGKKLVFSVARPGDHWAIHTANSDGGGEAQLLDEETYLDAEGAKWSPDSQEITFRATVRRQMPDHKFTYQSAIFVVRPDGTHIRQLTYDLGWDCWHPWWAHNENILTYSCYSMPTCMPENAKKHPDECIGRTFTIHISPDDPHAKPNQVLEQKGIAGGIIPELSAK